MDCRRATLLLRTLTTAKNKGEVLVGFPGFGAMKEMRE